MEETVVVNLRFASGALGSVLVSDATPSPWGWEQATGENPSIPASGLNCYRFMGTRGALEFPHLKLWRHADPGASNWHHALQAQATQSGPRAALKQQLEHFCAVVRGEQSPRVDARDGLATLATALAVHAAIAGGEAVKI